MNTYVSIVPVVRLNSQLIVISNWVISSLPTRSALVGFFATILAMAAGLASLGRFDVQQLFESVTNVA